MHKILILFFLAGQFAMTPERQAAMDKASVDIHAKQAQIINLQAEIVRINKIIVTTTADKQKLIDAAKSKLGLDASWNWDDTTSTFVQTSVKK